MKVEVRKFKNYQFIHLKSEIFDLKYLSRSLVDTT